MIVERVITKQKLVDMLIDAARGDERMRETFLISGGLGMRIARAKLLKKRREVLRRMR